MILTHPIVNNLLMISVGKLYECDCNKDLHYPLNFARAFGCVQFERIFQISQVV